ncbi:hypothetical protein RRG08_009306 [Elysia crispata]|uniref:Uncharacterized protein n=1 Tax=Elysia crispata TaxID=231223 RepID=A0AAE0XS91_9GAST|nr:hypothetical protein RRG08_009306 [Elysia crispata]
MFEIFYLLEAPKEILLSHKNTVDFRLSQGFLEILSAFKKGISSNWGKEESLETASLDVRSARRPSVADRISSGRSYQGWTRLNKPDTREHGWTLVL